MVIDFKKKKMMLLTNKHMNHMERQKCAILVKNNENNFTKNKQYHKVIVIM